MKDTVADFIDLAKHPVKFRLFLLTKLPAAFFSGLQVREMDRNKAVVSIPYKWFTKNPFRSSYFACLAMAAEMSTGALAMAWLYKRQPPVSMLVTGLQATYYKKATGRTYFTCEDGAAFNTAITETIVTGEAKTITAISTGKDAGGEVIAAFSITWSFKRKSKP